LLSDDDGAALEAWVLAARLYADSSSQFVRHASDLSISSLDAADVIDRLNLARQIKPEDNGKLAQGLRDLSTSLDAESKDQRDRHPATATAIAELSKLFDDETE
jgi:hypothetical protein